MSDLVTQASSLQALRRGFEVAAAHHGGPGPDGVTLLEFARDLDERLRALSDGLRAGTFQPQPAQRFPLDRPDGRKRRIVVLSVRDRVVHHALAATLAHQLDGALHDAAWAYRKGRSGRGAINALETRLRSLPKPWVFRADIEDFFDSIPQSRLVDSLVQATGEPALGALLERLLHAGQLTGGVLVDEPLGTPQGSALSPFLANLFLTPFDQAVSAAGHLLVRYGDDLAVAATSCQQAMTIEGLVRQLLASLGLSLAEAKVRIARLDEGFDFLGFRINAAGRRPGERAGRALAARLDALRASGRPDTAEERDRVLRGWLAYYGAFDASLPEPDRSRAEALEAAWVQRRQEGGLREALAAELAPRDASQPPASPPGSARSASVHSSPSTERSPRPARSQEFAPPAAPPAAPLPDTPPDSWSPSRLEAERLARQGRFGEAAQVPVRAPRSVPGDGPAGEPARSPVPLPPSALASCPRAQELYLGCHVLRALVDRACDGRGLAASERFLVADILGRIGDEAERACDAVFRHLVDHKPGMGKRYLVRLYPQPTSCARIRQRMPELTAEVGCDCRFRLGPGAYPTPVLHVLGAAEVPGLEGRVQKATVKRTVARAALEAINTGHRDLGDRAAALCTRLADIRRQARLLQLEQAKVESQLGTLLDEVGDGALETPAGTLRRQVDSEGHARFVLEV